MPSWSVGWRVCARQAVYSVDERALSMRRLEGKTALVTGAARGIGLAAVRAMVREGAMVWAVDRDAKDLEALRAEPHVQVALLDVTDAAGITRLAEQVGSLEVLFNCAGYVHHGTVLGCTDAAWDTTMDVNVKSMFRLIKAFLPGMIRAQAGSIINMSSMASSVKGAANRFAYSTSKAAVIGLTKSVAIDYIRDGLRCNAICPGIVDTPSLRDRMSAMPDPEAATKAFVARQPTGRLARAEEIAPLVVYLASDEASFVTGAVYSIDGGITL